MNLVWKLLRQHINKGQFVGFAIANLIGMVIVMLGVQFYADTNKIFSAPDGFMKEEYMVVSKKVSTIGSILGSKGGFSDDEIKQIESQTFTKSVGRFTSSQFKVYAKVEFGGNGVSSDIFFESVPDRYVDVESERWIYNVGEEMIPIIVPRNYLNLYNFGFSQGRSMPKLSEGAISKVLLDINIWGRNGLENFKGRVVGFSDRLNTILVPETFMLWANDEFGINEYQQPVRLIVEVKNPTDEGIPSFFESNGYESEGDVLNASKITYFLRLIVTIVIVIGLIISALAFYVLMLSIYLLLEKNIIKLETLLLLGYSQRVVSMPYQILAIGLNMGILLFSILIVWGVRSVYLNILMELYPQIEIGMLSPSILTGLILFVATSAMNMFIIRWRVIKIS